MEKEGIKRVLFFNYSNKYYCKHDDITSKVDDLTFDILKRNLILPYEVEFVGYSKFEVSRVILDLYEKELEVQVKERNIGYKDDYHLIVTFKEKKNIIDAYKIPNINSFYGRTNNINPYTITNLNSKKILLEVTKDYAKQNEDDYYFLADELTEEERVIFDDFYTELEYDYLYKLQDEIVVNNVSNEFKKSRKR